MNTALRGLVAAVESAIEQGGSERDMCESMAPALAKLLADPAGIPAEAKAPFEGGAVGNLLHADPDGRFHILAVVFPDGTSSGMHHHGCWGVIGYLEGGDEETRYDDELNEVSRRVWQTGDIAYLLPEEGAGWHRVRCLGGGAPGVSVHVLCRTPSDHPHRFYDRSTGRILAFPFMEVAPGRWRAEVEWPD